MIQFKNSKVTVFQSSLFATTSTVIETADIIFMVDPAWLPNEVEEIHNYVNKIKGLKPVYLMFTHSDYDHIIGYKAFPGAISIGSRKLKERDDKERILEEIKNFDDNYYLTREYKIEYPDIDITVTRDNQELIVGDTKIIFHNAGGHTDDSIFAIIEPLGILIVGDYLSNLEFPYIYHNSNEYVGTLHKAALILDKHNIKLLIPGHGVVTEEFDEMKKRINDSFKYIEKLRQAVISNNYEGINKLVDSYKFSRYMRKTHEENIKILKNELKNKKGLLL